MSDEDKHKLLMDILEKISDQQAQSNEQVDNMDKKLDLHIQRMDFELNRINALDTHQNKLLEEYEEHVKDNEKRFEELEEPRKWIRVFVKLIITSGSVILALFAILEFIKLIKGK